MQSCEMCKEFKGTVEVCVDESYETKLCRLCIRKLRCQYVTVEVLEDGVSV